MQHKIKLFSSKIILFIIFLFITVSSTYWLIYIHPYIHSNDAYIEGNQIHVSSVKEGKIFKQYVKEGDRVEKGTLLFQLDDHFLQLEKKEALANLEMTQEHITSQKQKTENAMINYIEKRKLKDQGLVNQDELVLALNTLEKEKQINNDFHSSLNIQKIHLEKIDEKIAQRKVYAPFEGVIGKCFKHAGSFVKQGEPVFSLYDSKKMWTYAHIKEDQLKKIKLGDFVKITLKAYPDLVLDGKVLFILPTASKENKLIPIKISINLDDFLDNQNNIFICNGMSAEVDIKIK